MLQVLQFPSPQAVVSIVHTTVQRSTQHIMDYLGEDTMASQAKTKHDRPFRVIIAGGGIAGLVMSHALQKAKIDHVVLEKGGIAPAWGASISMWAHGARILQQIDCFEATSSICTPLKRMYGRTSDGKTFVEDDIFPMIFKRYVASSSECVNPS